MNFTEYSIYLFRFAYGGIVWEMYMKEPMFKDYAPIIVRRSIHKGQREDTTKLLGTVELLNLVCYIYFFIDTIKKIVDDCWLHDPASRPSSLHIVRTLNGALVCIFPLFFDRCLTCPCSYSLLVQREIQYK